MTKTATTQKAAAKPRGANAPEVLPGTPAPLQSLAQQAEAPNNAQTALPSATTAVTAPAVADSEFEEGPLKKTETWLIKASGLALQVSARTGTFRRAGRTFTTEPTLIPLADLTEAEVIALGNEPALLVQGVERQEQGGN